MTDPARNGHGSKTTAHGKDKKKGGGYINANKLHNGRNLILCSCQKYKERICGRDLKLQLGEFIKQYLAEKKEDETNEKKEENTADEPKESESKESNENEDLDLKPSSKSDANTESANGAAESVADAIKR